jgi:hypothetical protein
VKALKLSVDPIGAASEASDLELTAFAAHHRRRRVIEPIRDGDRDP